MEVKEENMLVSSMVNITSQYIPMQLVIRQDLILNVAQTANKKLMVGDQILIKQNQQEKYAKISYKGPRIVTVVRNNRYIHTANKNSLIK